MSIPITAQENFTIIVNWKQKGFGCSKACSYCNWRTSPMLPLGPQLTAVVTAFVKQCKKSFITISGGGDPLYRFEENLPSLLCMINTIRAAGFKVRIITREVQHVAQLRGVVDHVSISLDDDVLKELAEHSQNWGGMDIEYSLVLPPLPADMLVGLKPQYAALRTQLGRRLVLRENFNSIFPLNVALMSFGHKGIVCVPKSLCLRSRYLSTVDCSGHEIVQDNEALTGYLMNRPDVFLFGGFVKHLIDPAIHLEYGDIDVSATNPVVMDQLAEKFAFNFLEVSPEGSYPCYFIGKSVRAGKTIQLVLMHSAADARKFVLNAQYDVDRVGYSQGFFFDPVVGEVAIRNAISSKTARLVEGPRSMDLFHASRSAIEQRHKSKLIQKKFVIAQ